ncbi:MAG TPA: preprotein translocase subunit SecA [Spirochaetia bacterium]|nr:preprotein translocase subunit SecA [Spirochaetia bacterium]
MIPRLREAKKDEQGKEIPGTGDFVIDEKDRNIILTEDGVRKVEKFLAVENLYDNRNIDLVHHVNQALRAHKLFKKDVDYMVEEGQVVIIDEFTGRKMEGRRFSDGLHQALEAKERVNIESENQTLATITYQNYFRMYKKLAGMTGTADTEAMEFKKIYNLEVVVVPTNVACIRRDFADRIYRTEREKYTAILDEVKNCHQKGQPVLLGTVSVENSEKLSRLLDKNGIRHNVLNAKNHASEAQIIERAGHLGSVTIATNMAGRGTDIKLGPGVKEAGGLHVLGSERHESRRIDNQLRGRSGRQGDPGSSRFYLSLEDELMRLFGSERISNIMLRLGMEEGQEIEHALVNRAIENAQKKVESRNFDIRKHLLEYDDVMNQQRKYVYEERDFVLNQDSILDKIFEIIERVVEQQMDILSESRQKVSEQLYQGISTWMAGGLGVKYDLPLDKFLKLGFQQAADSVIEFLKKAYRRREENNASEIFRLVEKQVMLQIIDNRWKEHLLNMDHLREGISLRAYAERKPLTEYKHEGFRMFREMIQNLEAESLEILFRMVVTRRPDFSSPGAQGGTEIKNGGGALEEARSSAQHTPSSSPAAALKNKIGRNEICPCGSGKKFKHCCGRN